MTKETFDRFVRDETRGLYVPRGMETPGKAYGFFDCRSSKDEIEESMPKIRKYAQTPLKVGLSLTDDLGRITGDSDLMAIAEDARNEGMRYALEATYRGATNREVADEVEGFLNQTYQTQLFDKGEPFRGDVIFQLEGKYVFRD